MLYVFDNYYYDIYNNSLFIFIYYIIILIEVILFRILVKLFSIKIGEQRYVFVTCNIQLVFKVDFFKKENNNFVS